MPASGETLVEIFHSRAFATPDRTAFRVKREGHWESLSFREYHEQAREVANGLLSVGIGRGDRVAILSANRPEWLVCDMAIMMAGAATVAVYPSNSPPQVAQIIGHSEATVAIAEDEAQLQKILESRDALEKLEKIVTISGNTQDDRVVSLADFRRLGVKHEQSQPTQLDERIGSAVPGDLAGIVYTSGTTGEPKGAMLTHANFVWTTKAVADFIALNEGERLISYLPLSHIFERLVSAALGAFFGFEIWFAESAATLLDNLQDCRPTVFVGVPRVYEKFYNGLKSKIADNPKRKIIEKAIAAGREKAERDLTGKSVPALLAARTGLLDKLVLSKVRHGLGMDQVRFAITGAAPIDAEIITFIHAIGIDLLDGYGETETTAPVSLNPLGEARIGTVGKPLGGLQVAFAEDGELLVKGGNVFAGYFKDEAATRATMTGDGFLKTGDVGELDAEGYLRITDRKKDLFKTAGGKYVAPQLIEGRLTLEPLIAQAVVVGDRRPFPSALLTLDPEAAGKWAAERGLQAQGVAGLAAHPDVLAAIEAAVGRVNEGLSGPERIKKWTLLPEGFTQEAGEITPTLKVRRAMVTQKFSAEIEAMYKV